MRSLLTSKREVAAIYDVAHELLDATMQHHQLQCILQCLQATR